MFCFILILLLSDPFISRNELRCKFGKMKITAAPPYDHHEMKRLRVRYIKEYAHALQEEAEGRGIVVYMDETYLNVGCQRAYSWIPNGTDKHKNELRSAKGSGRLIVLHAITKDGLLADSTSEVLCFLFALISSKFAPLRFFRCPNTLKKSYQPLK